jgi:superfamily I DNA/RNA helicase
VRNNKEVDELSQYFEQNGVCVVSKLNTDILKNNYVEFILKYITLLHNTFTRDEYFIDIARSSMVGLDQVDIFKLNKYLYNLNYTKKIKISFFDIFCEIEKSEIDFSNKQSLQDFKDNFLDLSQKMNDLNFLEFFSYFINKIGIIPYIEKYGNFDDLQDVFTLLNKIKSFMQTNTSFHI